MIYIYLLIVYILFFFKFNISILKRERKKTTTRTMLNFVSSSSSSSSSSSNPNNAAQAPEWQVVQRGDKKTNSKKQSGVGGRMNSVPSLCDILDSPDPKAKEDFHGQVVVERGSGGSSGMSMSVEMGNETEDMGEKKKKGKKSKRKKRAEDESCECLDLKLRIEELESLINSERERCEEAVREAGQLREENNAVQEEYERLKFVYFDSLCEAVKLDVSEGVVSHKRRRVTRRQWVDLGAGAEQSSRDLFAEACGEGVEPTDYPAWVSSKLSTTSSRQRKESKR